MHLFHGFSLRSQLSLDSLHSNGNQGAWLLIGGSCFLMLWNSRFSQLPCIAFQVFQPLQSLVLLTGSLQIEGFSTIIFPPNPSKKPTSDCKIQHIKMYISVYQKQ
uniref:Uncharacterized protein n=1 Tax=Aotus nancymaae TaxID=37293 RepID=A0A2K5CNP5_AOTNA